MNTIDSIAEIIIELKSATGWQNIKFKNGYFVFDLTLPDIRVIKGMKNGNDCLFLDYDAFKELPLAFVVRVGETVHQYWTRNRVLHRTEGRPAYVSFDPNQQRIIRRWHWNGILHRDDGPSKEMLKGFISEEVEGLDGFARESWEYMELEWYQEGFPAQFPWVSKAVVDAGHRFRDVRTGKIHSPRPDLTAWTSERTEYTWVARGGYDGFYPDSAEILDLSERYDQGKFVDRAASMADFSWKRDTTELDFNKMTKYNEELKEGELFSAIDLWGKLFDTAETEFLLLTEFERIGSDEGVD